MKNLAVVNYCRAHHRFVGLARKTLVAAFVLVAYNIHMVRQWQARIELAEPTEPDFEPTELVATRPPDPPAAKHRRGPKGLEFLAGVPSGAPPPD